VHTALVTGSRVRASGRALAVALLQSGSAVVLADLDGPAAERAADELGPRASAAALDVRDRDAVRELVQRVDRDAGGLDLLVNNAGTGVGGAFSTLTSEHWRDLLEVNLYGRAARDRGGLPADAGARVGPDLQHLVAVRARPGADAGAVLHEQVRGGRAVAGAAGRGGRLRRPGQRALPGLHRDAAAGRRS
jgi:NAD(P)-dependent dehydrogenase (short-subunit alcohol dehydrogenase family)